MTFDISLTKSAIRQVEEAAEQNGILSRLMTDVANGRGYMIMQGSTTVSVVARQDGERRVLKIYATPLLSAKRYTKEEAEARHRALPDPSLYRVVKLREAIKVQGDALAAYAGELNKYHEDSCRGAGMEVSR
ncbi:MAG: hypothetical protein ACRDC7_18175 [Aeromonas veronii]